MPILTFHHIADKFILGADFYGAKRFDSLLGHLRDEGYKFVSLKEYLRQDDSGKAVAITFDDGYNSFATRAWPIMKEHGVPAAIFIPPGYMGKQNVWDYGGAFRRTDHLSSGEVRRLAEEGVQVGSHGYWHHTLVGMTGRLLRLELERSKKELEDITGRRVDFISYPFGRFNERVEKMALELDYERGFSLSYFRKSLTGFTLPRLGVYAFDTPWAVRQKLVAGPLNYLERVKGEIVNAYSFGTVLWNRMTRGHAKGGV